MPDNIELDKSTAVNALALLKKMEDLTIEVLMSIDDKIEDNDGPTLNTVATQASLSTATNGAYKLVLEAMLGDTQRQRDLDSIVHNPTYISRIKEDVVFYLFREEEK